MNMFETDYGARLLMNMTKEISRVADELSKANKMREAEMDANELGEFKGLWMRMTSFASGEDLDSETVRNQLHGLWVALCICADYEPDTGSYDHYMMKLWEVIEKNTTNPFRDFESFDAYMCTDLI